MPHDLSHVPPTGPPDTLKSAPDQRTRVLEHAIAHASHLLPAQGPISVFIHHNTLHAFEDRPFEQAVVEAGELFGCEPFLSEDRYREEHLRGRIHEADMRHALEQSLRERGNVRLGDLLTRFELRFAALHLGISTPPEAELLWLMEETSLLRRFRGDAPKAAQHRVVEGFRRGLARWDLSAQEQTEALHALWDACVRAAGRELRNFPGAAAGQAPIRHRDTLLALTGQDSDDLVHPLLIRLCAAFLDQGIAYWPMPGREDGLYAATRELYGQKPANRGDWLDFFSRELSLDREFHRTAADSVMHSLDEIGVMESEWGRYVAETLLALRGWAGMIYQMELRPDRAPVHAPAAKLVDFLAVRLIADRTAMAFLQMDQGRRGPITDTRMPPSPTPASNFGRAYTLFQVAQLVGRSAREIDRLTARGVAEILGDLDAFPGVERRRLLHQAYERRYRTEIFDALAVHGAQVARISNRAKFQVVACIDEREESLRRHLEEIEPDCETFGAAGFFGVAMYYRGAGDARPRPLCPVVIRPKHEIEERVVESREATARRRQAWKRWIGHARRNYDVGSRTFTRGALLSAALGAFAVVPLTIRVLFPRTASMIRGAMGRMIKIPSHTRLVMDHHTETQPVLGEKLGYEIAEMTAVVHALLEQTGMSRRLSRLVFVIGHGSSSLNNPHESAHDCGACGGGRGGPNARAFALMANNLQVRERLAQDGCSIPADTHFIGAEHNSCNDEVRFFDLDDIPETHRREFRAAKIEIEQAGVRNAHERCRRFEHAGSSISAVHAVEHVEARTEDLAQPRPEYGHASNAVCVIGRRSRTKGLFLDRRAFLVSYDPTTDDTRGTILEQVLAAVAPVCAGINLEYYFSYVDPTGYGCGTKLPHNITGMLGVMDGHATDLRTGLPWQMVEIHEPVRLLMIVETDPALMLTVLKRLPSVDQLVRNGWLTLATLSAQTNALYLFDPESSEFTRHRPESAELAVVDSSAQWYAGRGDHLCCAVIRPTETVVGAEERTSA